MYEKIISFEKKRGYLIFFIVMLVAISAYCFKSLVYLYGISAHYLGVLLVFLSVPMMFLPLAFLIFKSLNNKIVLTSEGLLVHDYSQNPIPWEKIKRVSIKLQNTPSGGQASWLVLHTDNDLEFVSRKMSKINRLLGIRGVPVCNLALYKVGSNVILSAIKSKIVN